MTNDEIWLYKRSGSGTTVIPNPEGTATDDLEKVQIGEDIFAIPQPDLTNYLTSSDVGAAALSNSYNDLDNKPAIPTVPTNVSSFTNDAGYLVQSDLSGYVESSDLATVATSGSYSDLSGTPTIPTVPTTVSSFTNDAGYLVQSDLSGYVESSDLATVATSGSYSDLSGTPTIPAAVEGNPQETGTADLEKIKIGATVYDIPTGGGYQFISDTIVDTGNKWIDGSPIYCYCTSNGELPGTNAWLYCSTAHFVIRAIKIMYNEYGVYKYWTHDVTKEYVTGDVGYSADAKIMIRPDGHTQDWPSGAGQLLIWFC